MYFSRKLLLVLVNRYTTKTTDNEGFLMELWFLFSLLDLLNTVLSEHPPVSRSSWISSFHYFMFVRLGCKAMAAVVTVVTQGKKSKLVMSLNRCISNLQCISDCYPYRVSLNPQTDPLFNVPP